ncbi:hypothetical protein [Halorubrum ezzemoulense]|uniref:Uncharacterized protein n=2 Tax=Halorubrum ezzemoulense TaxID=337243 RepID=A0A256JX51_HALEZ|nr:hypothetical protein [Halorubrum ezzemoulense]OYR73484.1 hypothetical protein DJ78_00015 [Halorubrum ezzemoulense]
MGEDLPAEGVDFDKKELEELLEQVSDETLQTQQIQSVDDVANFPFEEANKLVDDVDIVDEVMDDGMREYTRLWLLDVTGDVFTEMEARRERV